MAAPGKPDLKSTHDHLHQLYLFLMEQCDRAGRSGSGTLEMSLISVRGQLDVIAQSMLDLEPYLA